MRIENLGQDNGQTLFRKIDSNLRSLLKRNVSYIIYAHTAKVADVNIMVTGRRGTGQVSMAIVYDEFELCWTVHCQGLKYILTSLNEVSIVAKRLIVRLSTSLTKM